MKWRKSSYSEAGDNTCVELAHAGETLAVRDSTDPTGPTHRIEVEAMAAFFADVKSGRYDV